MSEFLSKIGLTKLLVLLFSLGAIRMKQHCASLDSMPFATDVNRLKDV